MEFKNIKTLEKYLLEIIHDRSIEILEEVSKEYNIDSDILIKTFLHYDKNKNKTTPDPNFKLQSKYSCDLDAVLDTTDNCSSETECVSNTLHQHINSDSDSDMDTNNNKSIMVLQENTKIIKTKKAKVIKIPKVITNQKPNNIKKNENIIINEELIDKNKELIDKVIDNNFRCIAMTRGNTRCKRSKRKSDYCNIHLKKMNIII